MESIKTTQWITPLEAAEIARCNRTHIYAALAAGELKGYQHKRRGAVKGPWLIDPADLDRWIRGE